MISIEWFADGHDSFDNGTIRLIDRFLYQIQHVDRSSLFRNRQWNRR